MQQCRLRSAYCLPLPPDLVQPHVSLAEQHFEARRVLVDGFDALPVFGGVAHAGDGAIFGSRGVEGEQIVGVEFVEHLLNLA